MQEAIWIDFGLEYILSGREPTLDFASEALVLLEEGAMNTLLTVLARKLAAEGPAHLCRLKQHCAWLLADDACTRMANVVVLQHLLVN